MHRFKFAGLIAALSLLAAACATAPPEQLQKARSTYQQAEKSAAANYAPTELQSARKALIRAEAAFEEEGDEEVTRTLAYIALRRAQEAMAQGQVNYLVTARKAKQEELFARTEEMRQQYQRELTRQRQTTELTQRELEQQREKLRQAQQRLQAQDMTDEQMAQRERQLEMAIQRLEVEIERREQAEQQLAQAMQRLDKFAEVRQEDGRGQIITLDNSVLFEVGESELLSSARQRLKQVAEVLRLQEGGQPITIEGHTDSKGSNQLNERLSRERAQAVKDYLVSRGVPSERIRTVGYGEARPIATNDNAAGRAMNRRVEIVLPAGTAVGGGPESQQQQDQQMQQDQQDQQMQQDQQDQQMQQDQQDQQMQQDQQPGAMEEDEGMQQQEDDDMQQQPDQDMQMDEESSEEY